MQFTNGQRVSHEQFGLGRVTGTYRNDFETQERYDVVFDTHRGFKTVLGLYLTDAEPKQEHIITESAALEVVGTGIRDRGIPVLDAPAAQQAKEEGMNRAADSRSMLLATARAVARTIYEQRGEVYMDLVSEELAKNGILPEHLGNAAGSVFRGTEWTFTGRLHTSARKDRHAGAQRVWVNTSVTRAQAVAA